MNKDINHKYREIFINFIKKIPTFWFLIIIILVNVIIVLPYGILYLPEDSEQKINFLMWLTIFLVLMWTSISLILSIYYFKLRQDILFQKKFNKNLKKIKKKTNKLAKKRGKND